MPQEQKTKWEKNILGRVTERRHVAHNIQKLKQIKNVECCEFHFCARYNVLSELSDKYGSDKGSIVGSSQYFRWKPHNYSHVYDLILGSRRSSIHRVFECGIGTNNPKLPSSMGIAGQPGASLRIWRDYFPNAQIIGADIDDNILFSDDRISTGQMDQTDPASIKKFFSKYEHRSFDLMIDDGLHFTVPAVTLIQNSFQYLNDNGSYFVEDLSTDSIVELANFLTTWPVFVNVYLLTRAGHASPEHSCLIEIRRIPIERLLA
jgi:hypothetical protein